MAFVKVFETTIAAVSTGDAVTSGANTSGCDFFIAIISSYTAGGTPTVSAEGGASANTWAYGTTRSSGVDSQVRVGYTTNYPANTHASAHTFTAGGGVASFSSVTVYGFSGVRSTSPLDQTDTGASGTQPGSQTPSEGNCLLVTGTSYAGSSSPAVTAPFSTPVGTNYSAAVNFGVSAAYEIQTSATARNPTWTLSGTSDSAVALVVFRAAAAAGGSDLRLGFNPAARLQ